MTTKCERARWHSNFYTGVWVLKARTKDGGEQLARIERRNGVYFSDIGNNVTNTHDSLSAAQRAVRRALREVEQNRDREPPRVIAQKPCDSCGDPLDNLLGQYVMSGHGRTREVCYKCMPVLRGDGYVVTAQAK